MCILSGGENRDFFFAFDLFAFYLRFIFYLYLATLGDFLFFCVLNGGENRNLCA